MVHRTIAVIWGRFGPYHIARLEAAGRLFANFDWQVIGVEIARTDSSYKWDVVSGAESFERITLFPQSNYHDCTPKEISKQVQKILDLIDPEVVATVGWNFPEARSAYWWSRQKKRKAIVMSDSKHDDILRHPIKEWLKRQIIRHFDAALVAGRPHVKYAETLGVYPARIFTGYDVVDNDYFIATTDRLHQHAVSLRRELNLPELFFFTCARFIKKKNLSRLLEAFALYRGIQQEQSWGLVIAGSGELENNLHQKAYSLNLDDVYWPGFVQYQDLPKYYSLASAFIMPSITDQWGLVVNEAMASKLPVLVSESVGCRYDLVKNGVNGYIFNPLDIESMVDAMSLISSQPEEQRVAMGQRSRDIIANWGPERFAEELWQATASAMLTDKKNFRIYGNLLVMIYAHLPLLKRKV